MLSHTICKRQANGSDNLLMKLYLIGIYVFARKTIADYAIQLINTWVEFGPYTGRIRPFRSIMTLSSGCQSILLQAAFDLLAIHAQQPRRLALIAARAL